MNRHYPEKVHGSLRTTENKIGVRKTITHSSLTGPSKPPRKLILLKYRYTRRLPRGVCRLARSSRLYASRSDRHFLCSCRTVA